MLLRVNFLFYYAYGKVKKLLFYSEIRVFCLKSKAINFQVGPFEMSHWQYLWDFQVIKDKK